MATLHVQDVSMGSTGVIGVGEWDSYARSQTYDFATATLHVQDVSMGSTGVIGVKLNTKLTYAYAKSKYIIKEKAWEQ